MQIRKIVYHVNQEMTEFWEHDTQFGWKQIHKFISDDWERGTWDYIELRHSMQMKKDGSYGPHIII